MIARAIVLLIVAIALPDVYLWCRYLRRPHYQWWERLLWLLPGMVMVAFTIALAAERNFLPDSLYRIRLYLALLGLCVLPKLVFVLFASAGLLCQRLFHLRRNWGNIVGTGAAIYFLFTFFYGYTVGFQRLEVKRIDLSVDRLPRHFDGIRIVHFSDIHVGTYEGRRQAILQRAIDSINAQHADIICFTGDLQNIQPKEIGPVYNLLKQLKARRGVYSVLGNHDYSMYIAGTGAEKAANERQTIAWEERMGWHLLRNSHRPIATGGDTLYIAGMENDGKPPFPSKADAKATMEAIPKGAFILMLQHDPSSWERTILPLTDAQLTLSGHTHGGQFSIFGLRPTQLSYRQDYGLYQRAGRYLYVSGGVGGVVPYRYGVYPEITVITLHCKR